MNELEILARELFYRYAADRQAPAFWERLPLDRKVAWMKEVMTNHQVIIKHLKTKMKPVAELGIGAASYERGFNHGVKTERFAIKNYLDEVEKSLIKQLEDFIYVEEQKEKNL